MTGSTRVVLHTSSENTYIELKKFLDFYQKILDKVPEEFKDSVKIEQYSGMEYGSAYIWTELFYYRPYTKEEKAAIESARRNKQQYLKLKEEFDPNV